MTARRKPRTARLRKKSTRVTELPSLTEIERLISESQPRTFHQLVGGNFPISPGLDIAPRILIANRPEAKVWRVVTVSTPYDVNFAEYSLALAKHDARLRVGVDLRLSLPTSEISTVNFAVIDGIKTMVSFPSVPLSQAQPYLPPVQPEFSSGHNIESESVARQVSRYIEDRTDALGGRRARTALDEAKAAFWRSESTAQAYLSALADSFFRDCRDDPVVGPVRDFCAVFGGHARKERPLGDLDLLLLVRDASKEIVERARLLLEVVCDRFSTPGSVQFSPYYVQGPLKPKKAHEHEFTVHLTVDTPQTMQQWSPLVHVDWHANHDAWGGSSRLPALGRALSFADLTLRRYGTKDLLRVWSEADFRVECSEWDLDSLPIRHKATLVTFDPDSEAGARFLRYSVKWPLINFLRILSPESQAVNIPAAIALEVAAPKLNLPQSLVASLRRILASDPRTNGRAAEPDVHAVVQLLESLQSFPA